MAPLLTAFSALRSLSRLSTRSAFSSLRLQQRQLPLNRFPCPSFYSNTTPSHLSEATRSNTYKPHAPRRPQNQIPVPPEKPEYEMTFTCTPCSTRSTHRVSKQGYHKGSVLITCPECKNRHVISDHLGIFGDRKMTIEDLMREQGQLVKKGTLSEDGNLEFWADGSTTTRVKEEGEKLDGLGSLGDGKVEGKGGQ